MINANETVDRVSSGAKDLFSKAGEYLRQYESADRNVGQYERAACGMLGALALMRAVSGRGTSRLLNAAIGSALVHRAISGNCALYKALGIDSSGESLTSRPPKQTRKTRH